MQISKNRVDKKLWEELWESMWVVLSKRKNAQDYEMIFSMILGKTEKIMMAKRLMVGILMISGWTTYDISQILKMSTSTVYKYQRLIEDNNLYRQMLDEIFANKNTQKSLQSGTVANLMEKLAKLRHDRWRVFR